MSLRSSNARQPAVPGPTAVTCGNVCTAGLARRLAAIVYDTLALIAILMLLTAIAVLARGGGVPPGSAWIQALIAVTTWGYFCGFWIHGGQTIGMRAWRLGLTARPGADLGWRRATLRFVLAWVGALALGAGFLWSLVDRERLCWHDRLSRTRLIRLSKTGC